ncbi:MAG: apolipoprotein N-acyltransferase [Gammaproteobacteria bacterium]|nr:apolipoprotein N-acyltransferase [Gammaproteobacteria bacterium]
MAYAPTILTFPADRPKLSRLICFGLGCLTTLAFEPFGLSLLAPLLLLPLFFVCVTFSPRDAGGHAFWYGFGLFLTGTHWIYISVVVFGEAPLWIALFLMLGLTVIMSLWLYLAGWAISRLGEGEPLQLVAVAPAVWVLIEWLRGWVLSGFPWLALGYSQIDSAYAGWAPVAGVYGVSFAVVLSSAAVLATLINRGMARWISLGFVVAPWLFGGILTFVDWTEDDGKALRATVLQYGISQDQKWRRENRQGTLDYYRDGTRIARSSEIVVWPEVAVPSLMSRESAYISQLQSDARESGQTILFGILEDALDQGEPTVFNSVLLVDGVRSQVYRKRHLVPFGEYFPVPDDVREWMKMMSLPHSDLTPGEDVQELLKTSGGTRLAVMVCYEDAYGAEQLYAFPDAGILINVSNDAWFGDSIAPHQHLQIARMRSLEVGRPTIRATNTGISAFIDHNGDIVREGDQFREVAITESVQARRGSTPYVGHGNGPVIGICLVILGLFWSRTRR